jgi:hypothetical protein
MIRRREQGSGGRPEFKKRVSRVASWPLVLLLLFLAIFSGILSSPTASGWNLPLEAGKVTFTINDYGVITSEIFWNMTPQTHTENRSHLTIHHDAYPPGGGDSVASGYGPGTGDFTVDIANFYIREGLVQETYSSFTQTGVFGVSNDLKIHQRAFSKEGEDWAIVMWRVENIYGQDIHDLRIGMNFHTRIDNTPGDDIDYWNAVDSMYYIQNDTVGNTVMGLASADSTIPLNHYYGNPAGLVGEVDPADDQSLHQSLHLEKVHGTPSDMTCTVGWEVGTLPVGANVTLPLVIAFGTSYQDVASIVNASQSFLIPELSKVMVPPYITVDKSANPETIWIEGSALFPQETTITLNATGAGTPFPWRMPQDTVFVIDNSGSMQGDPENQRLSFAKAYVDLLNLPDKAATVRFDFNATLVNDTHLTSDYDQVKADIDSIQNPDSPTSPLSQGLYIATTELKDYGNPSHAHVEIALTDGWVDWGPQLDIEAARAAQNGITVFTIGIGSMVGIMEYNLRWLANTTGGEYYPAPTPDALEEICHNISQKVSNIAARKIENLSNPMIREVLPPYIHFVPGSFRDQDSNPFPPHYVKVDSKGNAILDWRVEEILINQTLEIKFEVTSSLGGYVPVGVYPLSRVNYTSWNESTETIPFPEVFINVKVPEPINPPALSIEADQKNIILSWTVPDPNVTHYLMYRAPHQQEFDFSTPIYDTSDDVDPLRTNWTDVDAASPSAPREYYYVVRAVSIQGPISPTSNTVGKWTKSFDVGLSAFSLPLEPIGERGVEWYADSIPNAVYINWMDDSGHWVRQWKGGPISRQDPSRIGESFEIYLSGPSTFTFVGSPASMIKYHEGLGDSLDFRKGLTIIILQDDVALSWMPAPGASYYRLYKTDERMGFHNQSLEPYITFIGPRIFWKDMGAMLQPGNWHYMVVPLDDEGREVSSTYSTGFYVTEYHSGMGSFALPLKREEVHSLDWYCDEIPNVVGMAYMIFEVWKFHARQMPEGVYDVEFLQSEGYQISIDGSATRFTFIGY